MGSRAGDSDGTAAKGIGDSFYYFGALNTNNSRRDVLKLSTVTSTTKNITSANYDLTFSSAISYNEKIYVFGDSAYTRGIFSFSPVTENVEVVEQNATLRQRPAVVRVKNQAYIFGQSVFGNSSYYKQNMDTLEVESGPSDFNLEQTWRPSVFYDGENIYMISSHISIDHRTDGIFQIDPKTDKSEFIPVIAFPVSGDQFYGYAPALAYIESINGVYLFGGCIGNSTQGRSCDWTSDIWFIDLNPLQTTPEPEITTTDASTTINPEFFSCDNKDNGFYPDPRDCVKFIGCHNGEIEYYECSYPMLFDPVIGTCNDPQLVTCEISCTGKPNGVYPHPNDCSLFVVCVDGYSRLSNCPDPLLFNPEAGKCDFPENVACKTRNI
jgi:hypothetical protein